MTEMNTVSGDKVGVLIVGGAYTGLSTALGLAWRGVRSLLVERRPTTATLPKAWGLNMRTTELLRNIPGVDASLTAAEITGKLVQHRVGASLVASEVVASDTEQILALRRRVTSTLPQVLPQSTIEKALREQAERLGADLRYGTELVSWTQAEDGVTATLRDVASGQEGTVHAEYLVAADGHASPIRERLGVPLDGGGQVGHIYVVTFEADLPQYTQDKQPFVVTVRGQGMSIIFDGNVLTLWVDYFPEKGESDADFTEDRCVERVRRAVGIPDLDCRIVNTRSFALNHHLARQFKVGRVILAGDAAHSCPPVGGQGGSLALQDGYELAWRLALVTGGQAGSGLLDAWEVERRPIVNITLEREVELLKIAEGRVLATSDPSQPIPTAKEMLGFRYHSSTVRTEPDDDLSLQEDPMNPSGFPGTRAPHVRLRREEPELSTQELFGPGFVLLTDPHGTSWLGAADKVSESLGLDIASYTIGAELVDTEDAWHSRYGISPGGAVLVRPDGVIAWRSKTAAGDPEHELDEALTAVLAR
ncbi:FAD-dependent monooxygenase [Amycolatopsis sp. NPDC051373]|uniref:FAD-dependent monooxygenase n=1 Tax=Amycolatopsis sp. NPDC051373 TaxID=3155801 RepID=UPI003451055A